MFQPENKTYKYEYLFADIDQGRIKIPKFQREFVWSKEKSCKLIDSILKGFPIGTFIVWTTSEELRQVKDIGNVRLPVTPRGERVSYILDGQQRITSLYAIRKGLRITKDGEVEDYKDIFIDLSLSPDGDDELTTTEQKPGTFVSVHDVLTQGLTSFFKRFGEVELQKIERYRQRLTSYDFSVISLRDYPLDTACEVFTRINTSGQDLSLFDVMVAKTYDSDRQFDLAEKFEALLEKAGPDERCLSEVGFGTVRPSVILQCIAASLARQVRRQDILKLEREAFINAWEPVKEGLFSAVDYVRTDLRIPTSELLPYDSLLVPLTYFFLQTQGKMPSAKQSRLLRQFFFWASLSERYSSATDGKIALDLQRIDSILREQPPSYAGEEVKVDVEDLKWRRFSASSAYCKAILCVYAFHQPKSFESNGIVHLDNAGLKRSDSKNFHHFFPRAFLKKRLGDDEEWKSNTILNITFVDDYLNRKTIRGRAPSEYLREFAKSNDKLKQTLETHLIGDAEAFGISENDYEKFISQRAQRLGSELQERLNPRL